MNITQTFHRILTLQEAVSSPDGLPEYADLDWLASTTGIDIVANTDPRIAPPQGDSLRAVLLLFVQDLLDRSRAWEVTSIKVLATRDAPNNIACDAIICFEFTVTGI